MLALPDITEQLINSGSEVDWLGPQQFPDFVKSGWSNGRR
jgi:hypothetical protein